ncbi:MAG: hypothetical protein P8P53_11975 [Tateyamaria sp.]|jgi:type I restriction enzyme R subunit|nr:hypothetical protein [Tateyamaria sp.]
MGDPVGPSLGFTGTPLLKKEKNTLSTFGRFIHRYAIDEAVANGAVVPLLYEGRKRGLDPTYTS